MKKLYTTITILMLAIVSQAQTFDYSVVFIGTNTATDNYQFALVATPSMTVVNGNTADMVAGFYVPTGLSIGNFVTGNSGIPAVEWNATFMLDNANGSGYYLDRFPGATNVFIPGDGPFELVLFDVIAAVNPTTGTIDLIDNSDSIWIDSFSFISNYMNVDIGSGTDDYYLQNDPAASSINFSTLGTPSFSISNVAFKAFPIPSGDVVNVYNPSINEYKYTVKNIMGQDMGIHGTLRSNGNTQLSLGRLDAAIYFITVSDGKSKKTLKVMIK